MRQDTGPLTPFSGEWASIIDGRTHRHPGFLIDFPNSDNSDKVTRLSISVRAGEPRTGSLEG
jgi:hypothetical protein